MFRGIHSINLDVKNRLAIPVRYRTAIQESCASQLIVTVDNRDRCLLLYLLPEWQAIERTLLQLPSLDKRSKRLQRLLIGHASECEMDNQGRILLPAPLRKFAKLEKQIVLVGQGKKFEIWDEESWNIRRNVWLEEEGLENLEQPPEALRTLSF